MNEPAELPLASYRSSSMHLAKTSTGGPIMRLLIQYLKPCLGVSSSLTAAGLLAVGIQSFATAQADVVPGSKFAVAWEGDEVTCTNEPGNEC